MKGRDKYGFPLDPEGSARFAASMMSHSVPRARRSKPSRPAGTKPPICDHCGQWLHPMYDHSKCQEEAS